MRFFNKNITSFIKLFAALIILAALFYILNHAFKSELEKFYLKVDVLGITDAGKAEIERQDKINALSIPFAQKLALINKTIFLESDENMVMLALGKPASPPIVNNEGEEVWVYYFGDYNRPTYLYFDKDKILRKAEKPGY